jgi:hypothetical protein
MEGRKYVGARVTSPCLLSERHGLWCFLQRKKSEKETQQTCHSFYSWLLQSSGQRERKENLLSNHPILPESGNSWHANAICLEKEIYSRTDLCSLRQISNNANLLQFSKSTPRYQKGGRNSGTYHYASHGGSCNIAHCVMCQQQHKSLKRFPSALRQNTHFIALVLRQENNMRYRPWVYRTGCLVAWLTQGMGQCLLRVLNVDDG